MALAAPRNAAYRSARCLCGLFAAPAGVDRRLPTVQFIRADSDGAQTMIIAILNPGQGQTTPRKRSRPGTRSYGPHECHGRDSSTNQAFDRLFCY